MELTFDETGLGGCDGVLRPDLAGLDSRTLFVVGFGGGLLGIFCYKAIKLTKVVRELLGLYLLQFHFL